LPLVERKRVMGASKRDSSPATTQVAFTSTPSRLV
jgi:hypothetical protein